MAETFEGYNARVEVGDRAIVLRRRGAHAALHGLSMEPQRIPFEAITAVRLHDATRLKNGWLWLGLHGEQPNPDARMRPSDPQTVQFLYRMREDFARLHALLAEIAERNRVHGVAPPPEVADQLLKLADLHAAGVLTEAELEAKRRALLAPRPSSAAESTESEF